MKRLLALLLVLMLCFALTACSNDKDDRDDAKDTLEDLLGEVLDENFDEDDDKQSIGKQEDKTQSTTITTIPADTPTEKPEVSAADEVAEYVSLFKTSLESSSTALMSMSAEAKGTTVVYIYRYNTLYEIPEGTSEAIIENLRTQQNTMSAALEMMLSECPYITGVSAEFYAANGDLFLTLDMLELYNVR